MSLTLNNVYNLFYRIIQSGLSTDLERKALAFNQGFDYYLKRIMELMDESEWPVEMLSDPTNISNDADVNYVSLPSDFLRIKRVWRNDDDAFHLLSEQAYYSYDDLLKLMGYQFFDTTDTGDFTLYSVRGDKMYFDCHFANSGSDNLKIQYWKTHSDIVFYDKLEIDNIAGTFQAEENITGGTSDASATIYSVGADYLYIYSADQSGTFLDDEQITGDTSTATADVNGTKTSKPQVLDYNSSHKFALAHAAAMLWHHMNGSDATQGFSDVLDNLIRQTGWITGPDNHSTWGKC